VGNGTYSLNILAFLFELEIAAARTDLSYAYGIELLRASAA
jgi:hypothetical protein